MRQTRFMYSAPTDHESALDLWQCVCIIARMAGWGGGKEAGKKSLDLHWDLFFLLLMLLFLFFSTRVLISVDRAELFMPPNAENNRCHLAESRASRPPSHPHGMAPTFAFGKKDSWGQKTGKQYLLANSSSQSRPSYFIKGWRLFFFCWCVCFPE